MAKKRMYILISIMIAISTGCGLNKEEKNRTEDVDMNFDYENSYTVIQENLNCEDSDIRFILDTLERVEIKGVIRAEQKEDDSLAGLPVVLEIESEDNKAYRIYMDETCDLEAIKDIETGNYVYAEVQ